MRYNIAVSVSIMPLGDDGKPDGGNLSYYKHFEIEGANFTEIAPKIDRIETTMVNLIEGNDA